MRTWPSSSPMTSASCGNGPVPADVVAGPDLDHVVALGHPEMAAQDDVMLVAGVGMGAGPTARGRDRLDDADVARQAAVDPLDPTEVRGA